MPDQKQKPSVFISIFTLDERDGWLCRGLAQFLAAMSIAAKERAVCLQLSANVKPIDWARNKVVKDFLASGCEWLLMVDSDMAPPPNLLDMIDRAEPRMDVLVPRFYALMSDVVAANSPQTIANQPGLRLLHGWQTFAGGPGQNEWSEIAWAGTGTMFVHRRVFEGLGDHGWFRFVYDEN